MIFDSLSDLEILGLTIIGEARGEPIQGQVAVGCVCRNRLHSDQYKSYKEVCLAPKQFSCFNIDDPNYVILTDTASKMIHGSIIDPYLKQCLFVARGIEDWSIMDNTHSSQNYLTTTLFTNKPPSWAKNPSRVTEIGKHVFLNV